jgi:hypothetical protein
VQTAKFIFDDNGVLSVDQEHAFLHFNASNFEDERWERTETELFQGQ